MTEIKTERKPKGKRGKRVTDSPDLDYPGMDYSVAQEESILC